MASEISSTVHVGSSNSLRWVEWKDCRSPKDLSAVVSRKKEILYLLKTLLGECCARFPGWEDALTQALTIGLEKFTPTSTIFSLTRWCQTWFRIANRIFFKDLGQGEEFWGPLVDICLSAVRLLYAGNEMKTVDICCADVWGLLSDIIKMLVVITLHNESCVFLKRLEMAFLD